MYSLFYLIMISENAKNYCCEDISLIENYEKAIADTTQAWVCHHILVNLHIIKANIEYMTMKNIKNFILNKLHHKIIFYYIILYMIAISWFKNQIFKNIYS